MSFLHCDICGRSAAQATLKEVERNHEFLPRICCTDCVMDWYVTGETNRAKIKARVLANATN